MNFTSVETGESIVFKAKFFRVRGNGALKGEGTGGVARVLGP